MAISVVGAMYGRKVADDGTAQSCPKTLGTANPEAKANCEADNR